MADKTVNELTALGAAPATTDSIPIWDADAAAYKKITVANFLGGTMTGAGTIATGGFTLTVPATGTASLLGTAQTYSALKTFSSGINLGDENLTTYDEGTWSPAITGSSSNPTLTYTTQVGKYTQIGDCVFYTLYVSPATYSGGSGDIRISLPATSSSDANAYIIGSAYISGPDHADTAVDINTQIAPSTAYLRLLESFDNASATAMSVGDVVASDVIICSGFYFV